MFSPGMTRKQLLTTKFRVDLFFIWFWPCVVGSKCLEPSHFLCINKFNNWSISCKFQQISLIWNGMLLYVEDSKCDKRLNRSTNILSTFKLLQLKEY